MRLLVLLLSLLGFGTTAVTAAPLQHGALSREPGQALIRDTLNAREWLGWEQTRNLKLAQLQTELLPGGRFAGFRLADTDDADRFADALMGARDWRSAPLQHFDDNDAEIVVGESGWNLWARGLGYDADYAMFLSRGGSRVGALELATNFTLPAGVGSTDRFYFHEVWGSLATGDYYAQMDRGAGAFAWLLWRDAAAVPAPGALGLALMGLALLRRRLR